MGISNIVTFDAHDPRMQNAVPLMGMDNVMPTYQVMKSLIRSVPDLKLDRDHFMVISPDEGALDRNMYYASVLGVNLGMFYTVSYTHLLFNAPGRKQRGQPGKKCLPPAAGSTPRLPV